MLDKSNVSKESPKKTVPHQEKSEKTNEEKIAPPCIKSALGHLFS
jgi:hypothetical protein